MSTQEQFNQNESFHSRDVSAVDNDDFMRKEYECLMEKQLKEMDGTTQDLLTKLQGIRNQAAVALKLQQLETEIRLGELKQASSEAWDNARDRMKDAWTEMLRVVNECRNAVNKEKHH